MTEGEVSKRQVTDTSAIIAEPEPEPATSNSLGSREEWNEEDEDYEGDDDADAEAEAEEIARRLRDQVWADINAARATANAWPAQSPLTSASVTATLPTYGLQTISKKEEAALATMKKILAFANKDALVRNTLATAVIPCPSGDSVLDLLTRSVTSRTIPKTLAKLLSNLLVTLARSDALFSTLRHSNAPALHLDKGKRKRDDIDDSQVREEPASKRVFYGNPDLLARVTDAVRIVTQTLGVHNVASPLDPSVVKSIQLQLHQIFLFAVTSSADGGTRMNPLQEISGLVQVIGVLSGIQIGPTADSHPGTTQNQSLKTTPEVSTNSAVPSVQKGDIGTAVYPCTTCHKIFSRLFSLRSHQRIHSSDRSYQCTICSVTFVRGHDLKRHAKRHEKTTWKCTGCDKSFSRRDAITRHKNTSRNRGLEGEACVNGGIVEVELDEGAEKSIRERQGKFSGDTIANQASGFTGYDTLQSNGLEGALEEGEIRQDIIAHIQEVVMSLHGLLSTHVGATLGTPSSTVSMTEDPAVGQATLASVIARTQSQSLPALVQDSATCGESDPIPDDDTRENETSPTFGEAPVFQSAVSPSQEADRSAGSGVPSLSMYGLSNDQALLLEKAIANAASAAQAQAEAEAALEEEEVNYDGGLDNDLDDKDLHES